jgi:hypothetical protein
MQESSLQISSNKSFNQIDYLHASTITIYSTSIIDWATSGCSGSFPLTTHPPIVNTEPARDLFLSDEGTRKSTEQLSNVLYLDYPHVDWSNS